MTKSTLTLSLSLRKFSSSIYLNRLIGSMNSTKMSRSLATLLFASHEGTEKAYGFHFELFFKLRLSDSNVFFKWSSFKDHRHTEVTAHIYFFNNLLMEASRSEKRNY